MKDEVEMSRKSSEGNAVSYKILSSSQYGVMSGSNFFPIIKIPKLLMLKCACSSLQDVILTLVYEALLKIDEKVNPLFYRSVIIDYGIRCLVPHITDINC